MKKKLDSKVICIGMHKTGTTTLGLALLDLGYSVVGARLDLHQDLVNGDIGKVLNIASEYDALQDVPWALLYKELDEAFPNSKFILTQRDESAWINSVVNHFGDLNVGLHEWIYGKGVAIGNEEIYLKRYLKHNAEVQEYFKDRPNDFMVMSLTDGDGWEQLCNFLNCEIPKKPFPYANKGKYNLSIGEKAYNTVRNILPVKFRRKILDMIGFPDQRNRFNNYSENKEYIKKKNLQR